MLLFVGMGAGQSYFVYSLQLFLSLGQTISGIIHKSLMLLGFATWPTVSSQSLL